LFVLALVGCGGDLDPPWQLDHDRIVAIRANPPAVMSGETSTVDGLLAVKGGPVEERAPDVAIVVSPRALADALVFANGTWSITGPDEATLQRGRDELGIAAGMPVPLQIGACFAGDACADQSAPQLVGLKNVTLGLQQQNPMMPPIEINGAIAPAPGSEIVVDATAEVPLRTEIADTDEVNWLTSAGTMHDDDLPMARITFEEEDPLEGQLALVLRDDKGGVTWQLWTLRAQ
jgi:hypothetical protein